MALQRDTRYPGRWTTGNPAHPQGAFKNRSAPGALDGSYIEQDWANDWDGFFAALLGAASITPNGTVDTATSSQYFTAMQALLKGQLLGVQTFTTNGTYTPTPGTTSIVLEIVGGGGSGGGCALTGAGAYTVGGGGGSGAYTKTRLTSGFSGQTVTIGLGGVGITTGSNPGSSTSFGALASAAGGVGGESQGPSNVVFTAKGGNGGAASVSGNILNSSGTSGAIGVSGSSTTGSQGGPGAPGPFGGGGNGSVTGTGTGGVGSGPGAGGGGSGNGVSQAARPGGNGANGIVIIWEYK
jgi:hypothetical protein